MERESQTESGFIDTNDIVEKPNITISEAIKNIAAYNARAELDDEHQLLLFLQSWWSKVYNRPLKDPLLATYTIEELLYEFYDKIEREKASYERVEAENDKIEEKKEQEALDWAEKEEKREQEEASKVNDNPTEDPENIKWMEEQIKKAKEEFGDSFGEDIEESF
mgnify:FL=1